MENKRVHYLSFISVIATIAVIMLHTNNCFWSFSKERWWVTANVIESVMYFAVPLFFMQIGATLIDYKKRYDMKEYFIKRVTKTVIPFFVWSLFGVFWAASRGKFEISYDITGIKAIWDAIINTSVIKIYWYFIPLFRIYLLIPLFACVKEEHRKKVYSALIPILFIIDYYMCNAGFAQGIGRNDTDKIGIYMSYVLCGYLIHTYGVSKIWRRIIYICSLVGLGVHLVATYIASNEVGHIVQDWKGYANIPCVLYSIGVFVLLKEIGERIKNQKVIDFIEFLSKYTFATYLIHWYILRFMIENLGVNIHSILYRVGAPILVFLICIGITWCIRKIPVLRKTLP